MVLTVYCPECGAAYGRSTWSRFHDSESHQVLCSCGRIYPVPRLEPAPPEMKKPPCATALAARVSGGSSSD